ncbi:hypothetical protein [Dactylosporangium darangshiense]|uniref:Uncharacterized protein n=1 Tax=Dactylosporangium darangshiense TaxID=579108 RepID=A0ABP8DQH5_9ACTN
MDADLALAVVPYVTAAIGAYGTAVVDRARDAAADATADAMVGLGRRLLCRFLRHDGSSVAVGAAVQDVAEDLQDPDRVAALRSQLRKALAADPQLAAEVAALLPGTAMTAAGPRSVTVQHNTGVVQTGDGSTAWQGRA